MKAHRKGILGITVLAASTLLAGALCACAKRTTDTQDLTVKNTSFTAYEFTQQTPVEGNVTYERLKITTDYTKRYGIYGDGCQWPVSFESSKTGDLMLYGLDVAGLYRSLDHGRTWETCNNGILNRGVGMFAIDPVNSKHVLAAGLGNHDREGFGMWRSDDMCETWNATARLSIGGERYIWDGLEFDPTSVKGDICTDVYYSAPYMRDRTMRMNSYELPDLYDELDKAKAGLYKSTDGGDTFEHLNSDERLSDGILKITQSGRVFIGNQHGLFEADGDGNIVATLFENKITDYTEKVTRKVRATGEDFQILKCNMGVTGLDCVGNVLYVQTWDAVYKIDTDEGLSYENITEGGNYPDVWAQMITVSPVNQNRMIFMGRDTYTKERSCWDNPAFVSEDGGRTWTRSQTLNAATVMNTGMDMREKVFIMDPQNEMRVLTFGADSVMISDDGGKTFMQANGVSNMMVGGKIHYNFYDPDLILYSAQDYIGIVSTDGGETFRRLYINIDGVTYQNMYGGFAADVNTYYGFASTGTNWYSDFHLVVTHDGGLTWTDTGLMADEGMQAYMLSSMQCYSNFYTLFAGPFVSHDFGYTWSRMNGCDMVYTGNLTGSKEMYGEKDGYVVVSYDAGRTWQRVHDQPLFVYDRPQDYIDSRITGIAFDHVNRYVYALCYWRVWSFDHTEKWTDDYLYKIDLDAGTHKRLEFPNYRNPDWTSVRDIAIDPHCTEVLYIGMSIGHINCPTSFLRSIDGGENWTVLTRFSNDSFSYDCAQNDGGFSVTAISVSPIDGTVTTGSSCYGFYKIRPPYDNSNLNNATPKKHTVKYVCDGVVVAEKSFSNSRYAENYLYDEEGLTLEGWYDDEALTRPHDFSKRTFNSACLYAKMKTAERVKFFAGGACIYECDIDAEKLMYSRIPQPKREGYVFGGWFTDESLTQRADLFALKKSCSLYAAFYKDAYDVFDPATNDYADYIDYVTSSLHTRVQVTNSELADNRCVRVSLDKDAKYLLTFTMDTRFRFGQTEWNFWQWYPITELPSHDYYLDKDDTDGITPVNKPVFYEIDTSKNKEIILYYWAATSPTDFMTVKNSIHIYKLVGDPVL